MQEFPKWFFGPDGKSGVFESDEEAPSGWVDHPSKVEGFVPEDGVTARIASPNVSVSVAEAAKSTEAKSQTHTDPAISAQTGVGGLGVTPAAAGSQVGAAAPSPGVPAKAVEGIVPAKTTDNPDHAELDVDGHPFDPAMHAATKSKTKAGLWRMKVGVKRPGALPGYPLDL